MEQVPVKSSSTRSRRKNRLGVIGTVYFQEPDAQPTAVDGRSFVELSSDALPFVRRVDLTEGEWTPIDTGWLDSVSMVRIENTEGRFTDVVPEPAAKLLAMGKVVEIGVATPAGVLPVLQVRPTLWAELFPVDVKALRLRSCRGTARVNLRVYPD